MDNERKKQLMEEYKNRMPEMGVICVHCTATGDRFLGISNDTRADFNSVQAKLMLNGHPNKQMQALWNTHGAAGFEMTTLVKLKYDDPKENHTKELEALREKCFAQDPSAKKIWR